MTHTLWNGNSREEGGLRQKCSLCGDMNIFWNYNFNSILGSQTRDGLCASSPFRVASKTIRERTPPPLTLLPRAARVCFSRYSPYREFALRLWWDGPVRMFCNKGISISRISNSMYYKDMWSYPIIWTLPPSSDHKPAKKGFHCHLKVSQHFRGRKTLPIYLKQSLLLLVENKIIPFILTSPCWLMIGAAYSWLTSCNRHSRKRLATPISVWHSTSKNKSRFSSYGTITKFIQFSCVWNICYGLIAFWYEFYFIWYPYHLLITHITIAKKQREAKLKPRIKLNHMYVPNFLLVGQLIWNIKPLSVIKCWIYNWCLPGLIYSSHSTRQKYSLQWSINE